jgi:glycosyltransferase involved in cell wall biosynthesis
MVVAHTPLQGPLPTGAAAFKKHLFHWSYTRHGSGRGRRWRGLASCYVAPPTMVAPTLHIITGEYAPAHGGVAEYCRSVACALAAAGTDVHVWAPPTAGRLTGDSGVSLHPLPDGYGPRGLAALARAMRREKTPRLLLVQYVPQAFGMGAMNVAFCAWIASLRDARVWVMFHEVAVPWGSWWEWKRNTLAVVTRLMAALLVTRADRVFVSIPSWEPLLRTIAPRCPEATWLPIPSNIPTRVPPGATPNVRRQFSIREGSKVIGHFGTYGALIAPLLKPTVLKLLKAEPRRVALLVGRGSDAVARDLATDPAVAGRVMGTGPLDGADVAAHLLASDVLVQPYPDGVSSRRTSVMAGLALGVPTATNDGPLTEPLWRESRGVELASSPDGLAAAAEAVLGDAAHAAAVAERGRLLYEQRFSLARTISVLCSGAAGAS